MSSERNPTTILTPDEAMNSYFGELLGGAPLTGSDAADGIPDSVSTLISCNIVPHGQRIIPTVALDERIVDYSKADRAISETFTLLLWVLYYLRQPVAGRVRMLMVERCHDLMMEYRLLQDMLRTGIASGGRL